MLNSSRRLAVVFAVFFATLAAAQAAVVWDLNPADQNAPVGSTSHTYTSSGYSITAYGFDNNAGVGVAHQLFYKNEAQIDGAIETGLGLVNTPHSEINAGLHFIQFDFTAALAAGMFNGQLTVGSIQANEGFAIYGSNALGTLGTQVGGPFTGLGFDNQSIAIPNFGQFHYYSIFATGGSVLAVEVRAEVAPVPEMGTIVPVAGLLLLVFAFEVRRRRNARA